MGRPPADPSSYQTDQSQDFETQPPDEYQPDPEISQSHYENYSADVQEPSYYQEPQPQDQDQQQQQQPQQQQQQPQQQQYPTPPPQGFGPQQPVQQPAQFPPRSPMQNPNQPTPAAYPPPAYPPPPPPTIHQPVQFPPPQSQNPDAYPPQGNPAQPVQFPRPQSQNPNAYPPKGNPAQPVQFPPSQSQNPNLHPAAGPYSYPPQGNPAQPVQFPPPSTTNPMYPNQNPAPYPPPHDFPVKSTQPQPVQFPPQNPAPGYNMPPTPQKSPLPHNINPAAPGIPVPQAFNQNWSTGIFDCMEDQENALETAFLPCVTFGQNAEIIDNGQTTCMMNGLVYSLFIWMPFVVSCGFRTKLREKYGLIEDPAPDWITHLVFHWCALCQEYRELKNRGFDPAIGWQANMERQNTPQVATTPPMNQTMRP